MIKSEYVENPSLLQEKCKLYFMFNYLSIITWSLGLSLSLSFQIFNVAILNYLF